ncbi:MAG: hypothetical protein HY689_06195 [Chloroflexi bacterium]|nr:hypothetical protein [Chloroflexota bacterium]
MSTQGAPERGDIRYRADGFQEGIGEWRAGGGSQPVVERVAHERKPAGRRPVPPVVAAINLVVLAVPVLWILGLALGGAPAQAVLWPVLLLVLVAGGTIGYWLVWRSS